MKTITAYHFVGARLRDGSPVPLDGEWLEHKGPINLCESGLHFSVSPYDALSYAPGSTLCRVSVPEDHIYVGDKGVARMRRIDMRINATELLGVFARRCALDVVHLWDAPDIVVEYLETGDGTKRAATWNAARAAAWDAVWSEPDAARDAARAAARAATWAASRADPWVAAWDATWDAARAATWADPWSEPDAARAAARAAQRLAFRGLVDNAFNGILQEDL